MNLPERVSDRVFRATYDNSYKIVYREVFDSQPITVDVPGDFHACPDHYDRHGKPNWIAIDGITGVFACSIERPEGAAEVLTRINANVDGGCERAIERGIAQWGLSPRYDAAKLADVIPTQEPADA